MAFRMVRLSRVCRIACFDSATATGVFRDADLAAAKLSELCLRKPVPVPEFEQQRKDGKDSEAEIRLLRQQLASQDNALEEVESVHFICRVLWY